MYFLNTKGKLELHTVVMGTEVTADPPAFNALLSVAADSGPRDCG